MHRHFLLDKNPIQCRIHLPNIFLSLQLRLYKVPGVQVIQLRCRFGYLFTELGVWHLLPGCYSELQAV
jgi:hypothetical protein